MRFFTVVLAIFLGVFAVCAFAENIGSEETLTLAQAVEIGCAGRFAQRICLRHRVGMKCIVEGGAFDNNLLCIGEKEIFVVASVADAFIAAMRRAGAFQLDREAIDRLTKAAFTFDGTGGGCAHAHLKKDLVGKDPVKLLSSDITYGTWDKNTQSFVSSAGGLSNAVKVTTRADSTSTGAIPLFFGRILNIYSVNLRATAMATCNPRDICFVVDLSGLRLIDSHVGETKLREARRGNCAIGPREWPSGRCLVKRVNGVVVIVAGNTSTF